MAKGTLGGSFTLLDCFEKGPHALVLRTSEPGLVPVGLTLGSSICKQGAFRPSKWNQDDITWLPPLTFYARGHLTHEAVALRKAAEYKSESRAFCVLTRAKTRQVDHAKPESGGTHTDLTTAYFRDILRSKDGRWAFRCSVAKPTGIAIWVYQ